MNEQFDYDYIIVGSGFGGSVSALRLSEKGYKVLVVEKGKNFTANSMPSSNWDLKRWLWLPFFRCFGLFKLTFFRHVTVISGVGVGGGSLVYANTLPVPKDEFFKSSSWSHLADWGKELMPFYEVAQKMLGATKNPYLQTGDYSLKELGKQIGKEDSFEATQVSVYFGENEVTKKDPFFGGEGPERTGCKLCGECMIGCKHNAKNTLDKNYLYFAQKQDTEIVAESEVYDVVPLDNNSGKTGYEVKWKSSTAFGFKKISTARSKAVIFSGGVLGTIKLLLKLKQKSLPLLSEKVGCDIRTNSEAIIFCTSLDKNPNFSKGIAIGSILETDQNSHMEIVRYGEGNGFWRMISTPLVQGNSFVSRALNMLKDYVLHPMDNLKVLFIKDWAKSTHVILFMQTLEGTLRFCQGSFGLMASSVDKGTAPTTFIPEAHEMADKYAKITNGKNMASFTETLLGAPTTAHILGGAVMGENSNEGVIDKNNHVFAYENMMICDGSMISANIGVNPSLTITAISERAMSLIPVKEDAEVVSSDIF